MFKELIQGPLDLNHLNSGYINSRDPYNQNRVPLEDTLQSEPCFTHKNCVLLYMSY